MGIEPTSETWASWRFSDYPPATEAGGKSNPPLSATPVNAWESEIRAWVEMTNDVKR